MASIFSLSKLKQSVPLIACVVLVFYMLPLLIFDTSSAFTILLLAFPLTCLATAFIHGTKVSIDLFYPVLVMACFIPSIYIFFNESAWAYTYIYGAIALVGNLLGSSLKYFLQKK